MASRLYLTFPRLFWSPAVHQFLVSSIADSGVGLYPSTSFSSRSRHYMLCEVIPSCLGPRSTRPPPPSTVLLRCTPPSSLRSRCCSVTPFD
ncbi:hypothetical protein F4823DRAFT_596408 [Ustulina deusta]|nr:hypothetical protein F4823DRAFT_596408 [Ustulina deusta]